MTFQTSQGVEISKLAQMIEFKLSSICFCDGAYRCTPRADNQSGF